MNKDIARQIKINGIVQGVGFRPFIYQLAAEHKLFGHVSNTSSGVRIHVEGSPSSIEVFSKSITQKKPPLAHITETSAEPVKIAGHKKFSIIKSLNQDSRSTLISPDVCVCNDCLAEMFSESDRRYRYPFINCTNCGPRYTIIADIPYDRPKTSMKSFKMCRLCQAEYDDPENRRFHAQPNACPDCGPHTELFDSKGKKIKCLDPIEQAALLLEQGRILAIKGLGGFHLAADAENHDAVVCLRHKKNREEKPFALMAFDTDIIKTFAHVDHDSKELMSSIQRPIVLCRKRTGNKFSSAISPNNKYFGVMLPYTPLHYLLLKDHFTALVMTSGNFSEEPIAIDNNEAFERLSDIADYFLIHNRDIYLRSDDSIISHMAGASRFIRRSRGYVPIPVCLKRTVPMTLACGGELKNTVCLTKGKNAFVSQHIGDLENRQTLDFFEMTISHLKNILDIKPDIIAYDMHPDYLSSQYAMSVEDVNVTKIPVQHHHAHIASCMAENRADGPVIGLALDGSGYGTDGCIWGGEVLIASYSGFTRAAHMEYLPLPGSAAAIKQPWRMAVSYLYNTYGKELFDLNLPFVAQIDEQKLRFIVKMIEKGINCPKTSSLGRFFDGVAGLLGLQKEVSFEGQAAMELEMIAQDKTHMRYDYEFIDGECIQILPAPVIRGIVKDLKNKVELSVISTKFHNTLNFLFADICEQIRKRTGIKTVALSGGVFQNRIFFEGILNRLEKKNFNVLTHRLVPSNDGGLCLGQAVIAAACGK